MSTAIRLGTAVRARRTARLRAAVREVDARPPVRAPHPAHRPPAGRSALLEPSWIPPQEEDTRITVPSSPPLHRRTEVVPRRRQAEDVTGRQLVITLLLAALATVGLLTLAHVRTGQVIEANSQAAVVIVHDGEGLPESLPGAPDPSRR
ncbi:hypothetical protein OED52_08930 [Rhodococcus sp. Z13]|uniref:Uncharacterized protein n=1 Tax=Rhodococcus sacchari TaxID=2962047 RepID=A0ACD4DKY2_9NOCA|nr:hypothetical protein [Rhodococcus sp. Z13]UYP20620.1 hypothetical protein OED52_08930 [Rhodococcus sp. Z13]